MREKEQEINALWAQVQALKAQLDSITSSRTYRVANVLTRVGVTLAPPGTRRAALVRLAMRAREVARREGVGGVRRGLLRKLAGLLRWQKTPRIGRRALTPLSATGAYRADLVSVVLPVYNQAGLLADAIESVVAQDYPLFELIVVNDGSQDNVEAVLQKYYWHPRVRILTQVNQKLPAALNSGFEFARGEFWTWTSADNLMEAGHLSRLLDFLRRHPEADMVYANYLAIDDRGQPLTDPSWRPQNRRPPQSPGIQLPHSTRLLNTVQDNFIGPCFLYRAQVGQVVGEYDPELLGVEDYDFWMRVNRLFGLQHLDSDDFLYRYRVHDNTLSARAQELGIYDRAEGLMAYEAKRAAFCREPWLVCVDPCIAGSFTGVDCRPNRVQGWQPNQVLPDQSRKTLLFASPTLLGNLTKAEIEAFDAVVAWIDGPLSSAYESGSRAGQRAALCLTTSKELADRAALGHGRVVTVADAAEGLRLGMAFANCQTFYRRTHPQGQSVRPAAEPYRPVGRPLRVLVQVDRFGQGGLEQVVLDLMAGLRNAGTSIVLLAVQEATLPPMAARQADRVAHLDAGDPEAAYRALLLREQIDLVSSHYCLFGAAIAHQQGIPFVQTVQNTYVWLTPEQIEAHRQADPFTTAYVCVSREAARYSDLKTGLDIDKMLVLPNGVAADRFQGMTSPYARERLRAELGIEPGAFVFLNVASIYPPKAQRFALRALRQVRDAGHDAWLILLGGVFDLVYQESLLAEVQRLHLGNRVIFAGRREDVALFHAAADAFLLPSFWEGCSLALAESVLAGLPVVSSRVGSADEFAGMQGITLVDPPYASILDVDHRSLGQLLHGDHPEYVERLARAMIGVRLQPIRPVLDKVLRRALDRDAIVASYYRLFGWLVQGGQPATCRTWLRRAAGLDAQRVAEEDCRRAA